MKEASFAVACKEFFGQKPGQTLTQFMQELKELTDVDKAELTALFPSVNYTIK